LMDVTKFQSKMVETISKEIEKQTVSKDLPRLLRNISISNNEKLLVKFENKEPKEEILTLFETLQQELGIKKDGVKDSFEKLVDLEEVTTLNTFLKDIYGEKSGITSILKCATQSMIINVILFTKPVLQLKHGILFKDAKGEGVWNIEIKTGDEIQLVHTRKEQVYSQNKGQIQELFQFMWKLIFIFDKKSLIVKQVKVEANSKEESFEKEGECITSVFNANVKIEFKKEIVYFPGQKGRCLICQESVFTQEMVEVEKKVYHQKCFKCSKCKRQLNMGNFYFKQGALFCFVHYKEAQTK